MKSMAFAIAMISAYYLFIAVMENFVRSLPNDFKMWTSMIVFVTTLCISLGILFKNVQGDMNKK